ncbi:MAG: hypothetical protein Q8K75_09180 [Chlamydiales bacterium]|nr:hypothetical protein [Chlamydiales bacterium]
MLAKVLIAAFVSIFSAVSAVTPTVSPSTAKLTNTVTVKLSFEVPAGYHVDEKALEEHLVNYGEVPLQSFKLVSQQSKKNGDKLEFSYVLEPLLTGVHYLTFRDITLIADDPGKSNSLILSEPVQVTIKEPDDTVPLPVAAVLPLENKPILEIDSENQKEIARQAIEQPEINRHTFVDRSFPWHYVIMYPLLLAVMMGLGWAAMKLWKIANKPKPPPTPLEVANTELNALNPKEDFDNFYVSLSKVLRQYIEKQYHVPANEMTTEEFMAQMSTKAPFDAETRQTLVNFLSYADRVKFAKEPSNIEASSQALDYARQFIQRQSK